VLRITITDSLDEQRWSLAGRLVGRWVAEFRSTWRKRHRKSDTRRCVVELNDLTFMDQTGEAALAEIMSQGAELIASGVYTKQRLGNLRSGSKQARMKRKD
jgi:anti-anti-sigma regulatory factor